jgi:class 3 adenylate cyclase
MVAIVFDHGGTVDKFIGDGLMVFFNDPEAQPDHATRAVRCAVAMQDAVAEMERSSDNTGLPLRIRIGVHTGPAVVGNLGSPQRMSYTAVGSSINLAQRLESAAAPGSILASAATAGLVAGAVTVTPGGHLHLKGIEEPVEVFRVTHSEELNS